MSEQEQARPAAAAPDFAGLVEHMVSNLVDSVADVQVDDLDNGKVLELYVAPADFGKVIGKQGRTAKALRTILDAAAFKANQRCMLDIVDPEEMEEINDDESADSDSNSNEEPPQPV